MATVLLMLGSVMSAVLAGNKSVKPLDEPPDEPKVEVNSSDFWKKEVERIKQPEPPPTDREPPPPPQETPPTPVSEPLDCDGEWSPWSECDKMCGGGNQTRNYTILKQPANGGKACPEPEETQSCNTQSCPPTDCQGEWSEWSTCTEECDGGTQFRNYNTFRLPTNGGKKCPSQVQTQACNTVACQRDPVTLNGYTDNGTGVGKSCPGQPLYSSAKWELVNPSEDKVTATSFDDPYYQKYQRRAAVKCNEDDRCSYLTVTQDGSYKTFSESQCKELRNDVHSTTWKKEDNTLAGKDVPINFSFDPQKINGYTSHSQKQDPPDKFSWRSPIESDERIMCSGFGVKNSTNVKDQGSEVSFDSDEYKEYVKNVQTSCELESDCNYISVSKSGYGIMYKECPADGYRDVADYKTFKRDDDQPKRAAPPEKLDGHDAEFLGYKPVSRYKKCNNGEKALANEFIREEGEEKVKFNDWFSWKYQRLLKRGIALCDKDPNCQYLELNGSAATVRTFKKEDCKHPQAVHFDSKHKIWEKGDWKDPDIQDPVHGYEQYGSKGNSCGTADPQSGWISQGFVPGSRELESLGEAESFTKGDKTMDDTYSEYLKQGAMLCNDEPNCKYVSVWLDGSYRTFDESACEDQPLVNYSADVKTWKKKDSSVVGTVPPPPPPPPPPEKHGYKNIKTDMICPEDKQNWISYSGSTNHGFESSEYDDNLKKGIMKCNDDPKCKYVTAFKDGLTGLVSEGECDSPSPAQNTKIWEKKDPNVIGFSPPPPKPKPPPFACNGNVNTQIPFSQVNDGTCDCLPGFDDEPETGVCEPVEKKSAINYHQNFTSRNQQRGVYLKYTRPDSFYSKDYSPLLPAWEKQWRNKYSSDEMAQKMKEYTYEGSKWNQFSYSKAPGKDDGWEVVTHETDWGEGLPSHALSMQHLGRWINKTRDDLMIEEENKGTFGIYWPYIISEAKSGWTRNVHEGRDENWCDQKSLQTTRSPGFTHLKNGINGTDNSKNVCIVYGQNTGLGSEKKCVKDHYEHSDCWERPVTDKEQKSQSKMAWNFIPKELSF